MLKRFEDIEFDIKGEVLDRFMKKREDVIKLCYDVKLDLDMIMNKIIKDFKKGNV